MQVIEKLIHPDQVGYVRGRFIGEGIKTIEGIIDYVKHHKLGGYLLAIDFEKAFDSLEWEFIWDMLKAYGFPNEFIAAIKMIYNNIEACVINGGNISPFFSISRGVRQGQPSSAPLFILAIELLLIKLRADKNIEGIYVLNKEIKFSALADDITNFSKNIQSIRLILNELESFRIVSGLSGNLSKFELMALGNSERCLVTYKNETIKWVDIIKITRIFFSNKNCDEMVSKNFEDIVGKVQNILKIWKPLNLSILGRITVVKTYAISQLLPKSNMVNPSEDFLKELNNVIFKFIWNDKPDKIKRTSLISNYDEGGLKAPNLDTIVKTQRLMWIKRFLYSSDHNWKQIMTWQLSKIGGKDILENTNISVKYLIKSDMMPFYRDTLIAWSH